MENQNSIIVRKDSIFSDLTDEEFRIICAYRSANEFGEFDQFALQYESRVVADAIRKYRRGDL